MNCYLNRFFGLIIEALKELYAMFLAFLSLIVAYHYLRKNGLI